MNGIIPDTSVISEPRRAMPDVRVAGWFDLQRPTNLFLTAITAAEIADGIERMPIGRRRREFAAWFDALVGQEFAERILPFDTEAALAYGCLAAAAHARGRAPKIADTQIAAVARRHGMAVATRNVRDFEVFGVPVVNPWDHA